MYNRDDAKKLDQKDSLASFRDRFFIADPNLIYLDGNSLGALPKQTADLLQHQIQYKWGERLIRSWNEGWIDLPKKVGAKISQIAGAKESEIIIADSTSINLFKLTMAALKAQKGRHTLITDHLNFPSDLYVFQSAVDLAGSDHRLKIVSGNNEIYGPIEQLKEAINEDTALVSLSLVSFKSGYLYDLKEITRIAHEAGALVLWDLSHAIGALPFNLNESGADLAVGCTYKYLNGGPGAPAFLYVREELQAQLQNPISGWMGDARPFEFAHTHQAKDSIEKFLTGTPSILSLAAVDAGVDLILEAGIEQIYAKSQAQLSYFSHLYEKRLRPLGFIFNSPTEPNLRGSHISLGHPEGLGITQALIQELNLIPDFRHPNNIRLGITPLYTRFVDIYDAVERVEQAVVEHLYKKYSDVKPIVT